MEYIERQESSDDEFDEVCCGISVASGIDDVTSERGFIILINLKMPCLFELGVLVCTCYIRL